MKQDDKKKNFRVKLAIVLLAILFWLTVKMNQTYDYAISVPLKIVNNNPNTWLKNPPPSEVLVEFSGTGMDLVRLRFFNIAYTLDISGESERLRFNLAEHREYVRIPDNLSVNVNSIVSPIEIDLEIDQRLERKVPVNVLTEVSTEPGFILLQTKPTPDSVTIVGPASALDTLSYIYTEKSKYEGVELPFYARFKIQKYPHFFAEYHPEYVNVFFDVQRLAEVELKDVPIKVLNAPEVYDVVLLPPRVRVVAKGGEKELAFFKEDTISVVFDFNKDWVPGNRKVTPKLETNLKILSYEIIPSEVEVTLQKKIRN
jgi:YbbR domain-containing protein